MAANSDFDKDNVFETVLPFRVLRNVHHSDEGTYHVQMKLKAGMDQDYAEEVVDLLDAQGLLEPIPGTDPMLYEVRYEGLVQSFYDLWEQEIDELPVTPEDFNQFLERYIRSYLDTERNSTIKEMLVSDFFWGLKTLELSEDEFMEPSIEEFESRLENRYEIPRHAHNHVQEALGFREEKGLDD